MNSRIFILLAIAVLFAPPALAEPPVSPLKLHRAYPVEGPENAQPSGLTIWNGELFTVSDRHDGWVYRIVFRDEVAALEPARSIDLPIGSAFRRLDFEGITVDPDGNFYLASETRLKILKVHPDGAASWSTPRLEPFGRENGLFQVKNAYLEAIAWMGPGRFLLCAERQPRGFLEVDVTEERVKVEAASFDRSAYAAARQRGNLDFSGLYRYGHHLYVLERNAFLVSRIERVNGRFEETAGWSWRHIETHEKYRYTDMRYGKAEGLCIDDRFVYIIADNNGDAFANDPKDVRPLLMVFEKPDGM